MSTLDSLKNEEDFIGHFNFFWAFAPIFGSSPILHTVPKMKMSHENISTLEVQIVIPMNITWRIRDFYIEIVNSLVFK